MSAKKEFKVNEYLTLSLEQDSPERDITIIYVGGKELMACSFLLLQFYEEDISNLSNISSIDEAEGFLNNKHERNPTTLTSSEEFFGHCSNLQAWYEYGYNTNLLHRNIAFPLLKRLTEVGDLQARKVFKEGIATRLSSGFDSVVLYLLEEGYIEYLSLEELESTILTLNEKGKDVMEKSILRVLHTSGTDHNLKERLFNFLIVLNKKLESKLEYVEYNGEKFFVDNNGILKLHITKEGSKKIESILDLSGIEKLTNLKELYLRNQEIKEINGLENLGNLEVLNLRGNKIQEIKGLKELSSLKKIILERNDIKEIKGLSPLVNLELLNLSYNKIKRIKGLEKLINLKKLILLSNFIKKIEGLDNVAQLEKLHLSWNHIRKIENINELPKLKYLHLNGNSISEKEYKKINWKNKETGDIESINLNLMN